VHERFTVPLPQERIMQDLPHHYFASAEGTSDGDVLLDAPRVAGLRSASPAEFGGPGDRWSPETLLVGAVADCFVLTFRVVARASRLPWSSLCCEAIGTLDRVGRAMQFTQLTLHASLSIPAGVDPYQARRALDKAEQNCLVSNSLKATIHLEADVAVAAAEPISA
jgi:organic hydroperoxide reductase OsmC/OhrA